MTGTDAQGQDRNRPVPASVHGAILAAVFALSATPFGSAFAAVAYLLTLAIGIGLWAGIVGPLVRLASCQPAYPEARRRVPRAAVGAAMVPAVVCAAAAVVTSYSAEPTPFEDAFDAAMP